MVHVGVLILSTITGEGQTEGGSCCFSCYIVYHYCLRIDRGMVHVVVVLSTITVLDLTEAGSCCCGCYIFYHYCIRFDRGVVHVVVLILSTITV